MKNIIKLLGLIAFTAIIAFTMTSCTGKSDLVGKWYTSQRGADEGGSDGLAYEFTSNGKLKILGLSLINYKVNGNTITTKLLGFTTGMVTYDINGTELTILDGDITTGLIEGTYYKNKTETKSKSIFGKDKADTAKNEDVEDSPKGGFLSSLFGKDKDNAAKNDNEPQDNDAIGGGILDKIASFFSGGGGANSRVVSKTGEGIITIKNMPTINGEARAHFYIEVYNTSSAPSRSTLAKLGGHVYDGGDLLAALYINSAPFTPPYMVTCYRHEDCYMHDPAVAKPLHEDGTFLFKIDAADSFGTSVWKYGVAKFTKGSATVDFNTLIDRDDLR